MHVVIVRSPSIGSNSSLRSLSRKSNHVSRSSVETIDSKLAMLTAADQEELPSSSVKKAFFSVSGMTCASCVASIEKSLSKMPGK